MTTTNIDPYHLLSSAGTHLKAALLMGVNAPLPSSAGSEGVGTASNSTTQGGEPVDLITAAHTTEEDGAAAFVEGHVQLNWQPASSTDSLTEAAVRFSI